MTDVVVKQTPSSRKHMQDQQDLNHRNKVGLKITCVFI